MDPQDFAREYGEIGTKAIKNMAESNSQLYQNLRKQEIKDSIERANQTPDATRLSGMILSPIPLLIPPGREGDDSAVNLSNLPGKNQRGFTEKIAQHILDQMVESAAKAVESSKESSKRLDARALREHVDLMHRQIKEGSTEIFNAQLISGSMILMAGMGSSTIFIDSFQQGIEAIQNFIESSLPMISADMRAELGYAGSLIAAPLVLQATALCREKKREHFVQNYAERLLALISDKHFNAYIKTVILAKAPGDAPLTEKEMREYEIAFKLALLVSAYALLYRAENGGVTGIEVFADIERQKSPLQIAIKNLLDMLRAISPQREASLRNEMSEFICSNRSIKSLADPLEVFKVVSSGSIVAHEGAIKRAI